MDIRKIRKDIVDCDEKIFVNSAGSSLMPHSVVKIIKNYIEEEEKLGGYKVEELRQDEISDLYFQAARLIGAKASNIAFAHDATDAYIKALASIPFKEGDVLITSENDYASNQIQFVSLSKRLGIRILRMKTLENGDLDISDFQDLVKKYTPKLVAVTHVPTNSGLVQDVVTIGKICKEKDILFLVDACQSLGQLEVKVEKINCDFLTTTGRKFLRGPRGTGFLYVSDKVLEKGLYPLFIDGCGATWTHTDHFEVHPRAKRFETWEAPYAMVVGFREALRYANEIGIDNISIYNRKLMAYFREKLSALPGVQLFDKGSEKCNILTFRKQNRTLEQTQKGFEDNQVLYNISKRQWGVIDFDRKGVDWVVRLSPHYFNTPEEMDRLVEIIDKI